MRRTAMRSLAACLLGLCGLAADRAHAADDVATADLLITMLKSGRAVVSDYQAVINDPSKGDKGFTGDFFATRMMEKFREKTGIDLNRGAENAEGRLLLELVAAGKDVITEYQPVINKRGIGFKGVLPAVFARKTGELFYERTSIRMKLTATNYRFPGNKPDEFEAEVLKMFADPKYPKGKDYSRVVKMDGVRTLRVMSPEYANASCLTCHGGPKGERDITGGRKEGWKEGDLGGAISVMLPAK